MHSNKVISTTYADVDGLHIRNLMITYFFRFFDQVVQDQHLYILETPLFRVRNKQETIYCYSEAERDVASAKLGGKPEITRFKGLAKFPRRSSSNSSARKCITAKTPPTWAGGIACGQLTAVSV